MTGRGRTWKFLVDLRQHSFVTIFLPFSLRFFLPFSLSHSFIREASGGFRARISHSQSIKNVRKHGSIYLINDMRDARYMLLVLFMNLVPFSSPATNVCVCMCE